ncbi:MAG: hypothetical protein IIX53_01440, partial [Phascolarctobacterium sp.]|nr:hypothetical protein [Phascolarctobacterium sp.]
NGKEVDVAEGSTIQDVIEKTNAPYTPGSIICLIKGKKELEKNITKYKIKTTRGSIIIELVDNEEANPIIDITKTAQQLGLVYNTTSRLISSFVKLGLLRQTNTKNKNRVYAYEEYLEILRKGTELDK